MVAEFRLFFAVRLAALACVMEIAAKQASACKCASNIHGKNAWEIAKLQRAEATAIFEGIPEHFDLQWDILSAKDGEVISADDPGPRHDTWAHMLVTFRVQKAYKGDLGPKVRVITGVGGGDCGARFAPGLTYLVYGYGANLHELGTSMCSPGGWIGNGNLATELRYLRNEPPISAALAPFWTPENSADREKQRQRNFEELEKRYAAVTGSICGTVVREGTKNESGGSISFLATDGYSPVEHPITPVSHDGSFCSERLGPGKYYLYFVRGSDEEEPSALYYPGVGERTKAKAIEVSAGRNQSNLIFRIPKQKTYSVYGYISTNAKSGLNANDVSVTLISSDGDIETRHRQAIDFQGSFPLPKTRLFKFEKVVPGRYIAYVSVFGKGWLTKKVDVNVSTHMKFISLELVHKN
jgi:hypothetical protein